MVTLPEVTPVSQAGSLQADLRRAGIEPYAWVLNKTLLASGTRDPVLVARLNGERKQVERLSTGLAHHTFILPWLSRPPIGFVELSTLVRGTRQGPGAPIPNGSILKRQSEDPSLVSRSRSFRRIQ